ncbi:unnamed protein product [Prorocentrum cordatum]|uniref:Secreted protein n=1 Tax=Prorocentrum cordatum TaxID=2364126 RepID=A0ABN9Q7R0_9DINO|nr:unnamed protein product [Polarella glacialis]
MAWPRCLQAVLVLIFRVGLPTPAAQIVPADASAQRSCQLVLFVGPQIPIDITSDPPRKTSSRGPQTAQESPNTVTRAPPVFDILPLVLLARMPQDGRGL